jgi:xylulokinase
VAEAAGLGAALLAGWATGIYTSLDQATAATVRVRETFEPDPARSRTYAERLSVYEQLYPAVKSISPLM